MASGLKSIRDRVRVSEAFDLRMGKTPSRKNPAYWQEGSHDWVSIADLGSFGKYVGRTKERINDLAIRESGIKPAPENTVLMSFKLSLGKTSITKEPVYTNEAIMAFVDKGTHPVDPSFMYHQCRTKDWNAGTNTAVMGKTLNKKTLGQALVFLPSLEEQRVIASRLDVVDKQIEESAKILGYLDDLAKSRFIELFGDPENTIYPVGTVEDIADVTVGVVIKPKRYYTEDSLNGVKAFRSLNVGEMHVKDSDWVYFTQEGNQECSKSMLKEGDVLIVRSGYPGTSCVVPIEFEGCNAIDLIIARPDKSQITPGYLAAFNNGNYVKSLVARQSVGSAQKHFNVGFYKKMRLPIPPIEDQMEFIDFMRQVDKSKAIAREQIDKLQLLYDSLAQEYFGD